MPTKRLFVDSEEENDDFEDGDDEPSGSEGGDNGMGSDDEFGESTNEGNVSDGEDAPNDQEKGKKRKGIQNRNEAKRNKKLKKLGPKQKKGSKKGDKQLTKEEIKELTEKEYTLYSNLYNVQLDEVLSESAVSPNTKQSVEDWIKTFSKFIRKEPASKTFTVAKYAKILKNVELPLPESMLLDRSTERPLKWMKGLKITWEPPVSVQVRGSWEMDTQLETVSSVDVFLEMPPEFLHKSDCLNHKYHIKRALYLAITADRIMDTAGERNLVNFTLANGDPLKPVVCVEVQDVQFLIRAVPPQNFFRLSKLACDRNNLRFQYFFGEEKSQDDPETSTQHYNFTILEDALAVEVNQEISTFLTNRPKFQNAVKLVKIWLTQRGLSQVYGGFSGFLVAQFMLYLFNMRRISESMSILQLLRVFFVNLVQEDLTEKGIGFSEHSDSVKFAQQQWDTVFLDKSGLLNFTSNMSKMTYRRIQGEARQALTIMEKRNVTGFLALFTTKVKFLHNFDHVIRFYPSRLEAAFKNKLEHKSTILDHSGFIYPVAVSVLGTLIERCLGQRITALDCMLPEPPTWLAINPAVNYFPTFIYFGLNIDREASQKVIEKCESDQETDIEAFKAFWGDKSELRRFRDGTLKECVPLKDIGNMGQSRLCYQMLYYILQKHLSYTVGENAYIDNQVEVLMEYGYLKVKPAVVQLGPKGKKKTEKKIFLKGRLATKKMKKMAVPPEVEPVSVDEITKQVSNSFDELSKILRQLEELPLQISTVQGTSAVLRFSHIHPTPPQKFPIKTPFTEQDPKRKALLLLKKCGEPGAKKENVLEEDSDEEISVVQEIVNGTSKMPDKLPKYVEPVGVMIRLETSGQWPDDMKAIERLKCAFLIKIGELLQTKFGLTVQPYAKYLDVLKDGYIFRIRLTYFRELTLLRQLTGADGIQRTRDNPEASRLEREALILPQLTSTLHSFHLQYEAFGKTCRLAKRWIAAQLLLASPAEYNTNLEENDCRFSEECVELLVACVFLNYAPHLSFPSEAQVGFQRFLYLLAKTDFHAVPIILNFFDKWTVEEVAAIELEFVKLRPTLPCIFIATPFDERGSVWTRNLLGVLLKRAKRLAEVALCVMEDQFIVGERLVVQNHVDLRIIFAPITRDLDVIINLKRNMNPRGAQHTENVKNPMKFLPYKKKPEEVIPVTGFDPVQMYLEELRDAFGHLAVFMHDTYGGNVIAVKWKPDVFKAVPFTLSAVRGRCVTKGATDTISTNINGVFEAFEVLGTGLVQNIEAFPDRWETNN